MFYLHVYLTHLASHNTYTNQLMKRIFSSSSSMRIQSPSRISSSTTWIYCHQIMCLMHCATSCIVLQYQWYWSTRIWRDTLPLWFVHFPCDIGERVRWPTHYGHHKGAKRCCSLIKPGISDIQIWLQNYLQRQFVQSESLVIWSTVLNRNQYTIEFLSIALKFGLLI